MGLDFDGVVAYNPFRIIRAPIKWFKREVLGINKLSFFVPRNKLERLAWTIVHESSVWPSNGVELLKELVNNENIEAHLVTARFSFLEQNLFEWLKKNKLTKLFKSINLNKKNEQPHIFKERVVSKLHFDYFIEDNLDIVLHLNGKSKTKIYWIYNVLDRGKNYPFGFPYLKKALEAIRNASGF